MTRTADRPALLDLPSIGDNRIKALTTADLADYQVDINALTKKMKAALKAYNNEVVRRMLSPAKDAYKKAGKEAGVVHFKVDDEDIKAERTKTISWDQPGTLTLLNELPKAQAQHYGNLSVKVDESKFKGAPPDIKAKLTKLRSEKLGAVKFTFEVEEAD